jgi:hypothetical protein
MTDGFFALTPKQITVVTHLAYAHTNGDLSGLLDFMAVSKITAPGRMFDWVTRPTALPLVTAGQRPIFTDESKALEGLTQTNIDLRRVVFLPTEARADVLADRQENAQILGSEFTSGKVSIETEAPAKSLVVISQSYYPAWRAYVDGQPARLWLANYAFQAVEVPGGRHEIQFCYEDRAFVIGRTLSALGLVLCLGLWLLAGKNIAVAASVRPHPVTTVTGRIE